MLKGIDNLALYFSGDSENFEAANRLRVHGIKIASLEETFDKARNALKIIGERSAVCPEQRKQIPLNGACIACGICVEGKANISFSITKK
jgi:hypothetical protein